MSSALTGIRELEDQHAVEAGRVDDVGRVDLDDRQVERAVTLARRHDESLGVGEADPRQAKRRGAEVLDLHLVPADRHAVAGVAGPDVGDHAALVVEGDEDVLVRSDVELDGLAVDVVGRWGGWRRRGRDRSRSRHRGGADTEEPAMASCSASRPSRAPAGGRRSR